MSKYGLVISACAVIAGSIAARRRLRELLRGSRPLVVLVLCVTLFRSLDVDPAGRNISFSGTKGLLSFVSKEGFFAGLSQGACVIVSFSACSLLFSVTTMQELRDSLSRVELTAAGFFRFITSGGRKQAGTVRRISKISLGISLMLGFLPRFFEVWESANLACDARAGKKGIRRLIVLIPLVTERMMDAAAETAEALEARGMM
jgi:biotin transport system permease protein